MRGDKPRARGSGKEIRERSGKPPRAESWIFLIGIMSDGALSREHQDMEEGEAHILEVVQVVKLDPP